MAPVSDRCHVIFSRKDAEDLKHKGTKAQRHKGFLYNKDANEWKMVPTF
jgi:hypothetical protein